MEPEQQEKRMRILQEEWGDAGKLNFLNLFDLFSSAVPCY